MNFTQIGPCFGFADVTQNADMSSSENLKPQKNIEAAVHDPTKFLRDPLWGRDPPVGTTGLDFCEQN